MDEQELKYRVNVDGDDSGARKVQESLQKLITPAARSIKRSWKVS
jgi:hypothetical protein